MALQQILNGQLGFARELQKTRLDRCGDVSTLLLQSRTPSRSGRKTLRIRQTRAKRHRSSVVACFFQACFGASTAVLVPIWLLNLKQSANVVAAG